MKKIPRDSKGTAIDGGIVLDLRGMMKYRS